jgi:HAD superfamily hydrolase (TIGR01490 family)
MSPPTLVFVDLDHTLIPFNSAFRYALDAWREKRLGTARLVESAVWLGLYRLSLMDMEQALARAAAYHRGVGADELAESTAAWFERRVRDALLPRAKTTLERHRAAGHRLILHTSSSSWLASAAAGAWGLDDWISNHFPSDGTGRLTGAIARPICYGHGKLVLARSYAERAHARLEDAWFYTDSASDAPLLEAVGQPRVVRPDPVLTRLAARRGWQRVDW